MARKATPKRELVQLELTANDRQLIRKYGYPFTDLSQALSAEARNPGYAKVHVSPFYLEQLLGNLAISIKECKSRRLIDDLDDLDDLYEYIEAAARCPGLERHSF